MDHGTRNKQVFMNNKHWFLNRWQCSVGRIVVIVIGSGGVSPRGYTETKEAETDTLNDRILLELGRDKGWRLDVMGSQKEPLIYKTNTRPDRGGSDTSQMTR